MKKVFYPNGLCSVWKVTEQTFNSSMLTIGTLEVTSFLCIYC